jgi:hypothetical protein
LNQTQFVHGEITEYKFLVIKPQEEETYWKPGSDREVFDLMTLSVAKIV